MTGYVGLNLLTETRVNIEQYGWPTDVLVPKMAVFCKCQTHTTNTGGNSYGQLQVIAEKCDIATPCYVVFVGIFSAYSPRSSIHFLVRCSKINQKFVHSSRSLRQQWLPRRKKNCDRWILFLVQSTGGSPTGPDPDNRVGDQDIGRSSIPVSSGLQVPREPGHFHARTRPPWWTSRDVFPSKCPSVAPAEMSNTPR